MITAVEVAQSIKKLPQMPAVVSRLASAIQNERTTPAEIEKIVHADSGLTAMFLRLANSAYFATRAKITSVRQATLLLGRQQVFELAVTASMSKLMPARLPGYGIDGATFWLHTLAVAVLAERLATAYQPSASHDAFVAGLLHDIGKLAIGSFLEEEEVALSAHIRRGDETLVRIEGEILGTDHCVVGAELARRWELPEVIGFVARWHHEPSSAPEGEHRGLTDVIHSADLLSYTLGYGADVGELLRSPDPEAVKRLGLKTKVLERIASETLVQIQEIASMFGEKRVSA